MALGLLSQVLYDSKSVNWNTGYGVCVCARISHISLWDKILMALKLKHDPAVDDVSLPKAQTLPYKLSANVTVWNREESVEGMLYILLLYKKYLVFLNIVKNK